MKKILAVALVTVMLASSSLTAFATNTEPDNSGSISITKEEWENMQKSIDRLSKDNKALQGKIDALTKAVQAKKSSGGGGGGGRSSGSTTTSSDGNYVNFGGNMTYQAGKIEINGGRSNVTFTIKAPAGGTITSANTLAGKVGGSLISCIETSSPGVGFTTAKVNFYLAGVQAGDNIAVYQAQGGNWVQLPVVEIRKDHVVVNMSRHGSLAFVRVPVMATITQ